VNIANGECLRYLRIKLDRTLTFRQHLETTKNKIKSRNIISKLARTSWGCSADTLRTSALSLVYSVAEYYAPVWTISAHCNKIDVELIAAMRIVKGTVRSTPTQWLPVLSNIGSPEIHRQIATQNMISKINRNVKLPIYNDIDHHPNKRLKSRRPVWVVDIIVNDLQAEWKKIG
jgi:transposase-like protein